MVKRLREETGFQAKTVPDPCQNEREPGCLTVSCGTPKPADLRLGWKAARRDRSPKQ